MRFINTVAAYIDEEDLLPQSRDKKIEDINVHDISCHKMIRALELVILIKDDQRRIIKTRY